MDADFWISLAICLVLVGAALWLIRVHWQHWQEVDAQPGLSDRDRNHLRRRHRRRFQTSTMLGLVGVAILLGRLFPPEDGHLIPLLYWLGVALLVCWVALLALADMLSTRLHYSSRQHQDDLERLKLQAQLRRATREEQARQGTSGKTGSSDQPE